MKKGEIHIFGTIDRHQSEEGHEWGSISVSSVKNQVDELGEIEDLTVYINSPGGDVNEGFAIYDYLKTLGLKNITTKVDGICASIATIIYAAGDERIITENSYLMIHNPWIAPEPGDADHLEEVAKALREREDKIANFYSKLTGIDVKDMLEMMSKETEIYPEDALEMGFATKIEETLKAVAFMKDYKSNTTMTKSKKDIVNKWLDKLTGVKNLVTLSSTNGQSFKISASSADEIKDADISLENGDAVADGEYTLSDNRSITVANNKITEVKAVEPASGDLEAANAEIAQLKTQIQSLTEERDQLRTTSEEMVEEMQALKPELEKIKADLGKVSSGEELGEKIKNRVVTPAAGEVKTDAKSSILDRKRQENKDSDSPGLKTVSNPYAKS